MPGSGIYFAVYEAMKRALNDEKTGLTPWRIMFAGGMSGVIMWLFVIPVDTLKSRLQTAPAGKLNGIGDAYRDLTGQKGTEKSSTNFVKKTTFNFFC